MGRKFEMTVVSTKNIEVEFTESVFGGKTEAEYLEAFRTHMWPVDSLKDVAEYAGRMAFDGTNQSHDFLGFLAESHVTSPKVPDVKVWIHGEDIEDLEVEDLTEIE